MRRRLTRVLPPALLAATVLWAFTPGLEGVFLWDDGRSIVQNPHARHLDRTTVTRTSRPLTQLSFAVDHAVAGLDPRMLAAVARRASTHRIRA